MSIDLKDGPLSSRCQWSLNHLFCHIFSVSSYHPTCLSLLGIMFPPTFLNSFAIAFRLDKTLQDIVYKLVPELFLKEMTRRKQFYRQYPQIACRVSPEERGEDTERTIFNPKDCISLSMEYVR